jgi:hypothetical protein
VELHNWYIVLKWKPNQGFLILYEFRGGIYRGHPRLLHQWIRPCEYVGGWEFLRFARPLPFA